MASQPTANNPADTREHSNDEPLESHEDSAASSQPSVGDPPLDDHSSRALPRQAVAILRAWILEHVANPYPTVEEKERLQEQTGLTAQQIHHWFTNTRKRVLRPLLHHQ